MQWACDVGADHEFSCFPEGNQAPSDREHGKYGKDSEQTDLDVRG